MDGLFLTDTFISESLFLVLFIISSILCREQFKNISITIFAYAHFLMLTPTAKYNK